MSNIDERTGKPKIILHLCCSKLASDSQFYSEFGYDVRKVGLDWGLDVRTYKPPENVYGIIANPPCTMFSLARTTAKTPRNLKEGMILVERCLKIIWECRFNGKLKFWLLENPRAILRQFLGLPIFMFEHWEYEDKAIKPTDIWGYFNIPKKHIFFKPLGLNKKYPCGSVTAIGWSSSPARKAVACKGFARAFFEANQ